MIQNSKYKGESKNEMNVKIKGESSPPLLSFLPVSPNLYRLPGNYDDDDDDDDGDDGDGKGFILVSRIYCTKQEKCTSIQLNMVSLVQSLS